MSTNRIPKAIHSRTLAQSVLVNLVAQSLLSFSQPMLAQSQQRPFASAGQNSQVLNETLRGGRDEGGKPTGKWSQAAVAPVRLGEQSSPTRKELLGHSGKKWHMWTRCCPICKRILKKFRLCDHIRCECRWEW